MDVLQALAALPLEVKVALGLLFVVQITLDVIAFLDLYKRPVSELSIQNKWVWAAIILFISTLGAIGYLVLGRKRAVAVEGESAVPDAARAADVAELLYGTSKLRPPR